MRFSLDKLIIFFCIQYALGRRGSFPYGLLVNFSLLKISLLVIVSDIIQTIILLNFFDYFSKNFIFLKRFKQKLSKKYPPKIQNSKKKFQKIGNTGVLLISALPYAGGALSGSIFAISLKIEKRKAFFIIISGCVIGTYLYYLGFTGIISVFK